jgi:putative transposase
MSYISIPTGVLLAESSKPNRFYRVLNVNKASDFIHLFPIDRDSDKLRLPERHYLSEVENRIQSGQLTFKRDDPFDNYKITRGGCSTGQLKNIDKAYSVLEQLIKSNSIITNESYRNALLAKLESDGIATRPSMYKWLKLFWRGNMNWQALLPKFENCGAPDKEKGTSKFNSETQKLLEDKYRAYHLKIGISIEGTIRKIVREDLNETIHCPSELITPKALIYHGEKNLSATEKVALQMGQHDFKMKAKVLRGRATDGVIGPLDLVQIDWTQMDIQLKSVVFKDEFLGRPYLYIVTDTTSRYILGFLITFFTPSYATLTNALLNSCVTLNEFDDEDFKMKNDNCDHLRLIPRRVVADRGEALSEKADDIAKSLGIIVETTEAYRGDLKPIVERLIGTIQDRIKELFIGKGKVGQDHGERLAEDSRKDATINIEQLIKITKICIDEYNRTHPIVTYPLQNGMEKAFMDKIPLKVVQWGIMEGVTYQRSESIEKLRLELLTKEADLKGCRKGINLHGDEYIPVNEKVEALYQELLCAGQTDNFILAYDPRKYHDIYWYYQGEFHLMEIRGKNMAVYPTLYERLLSKALYSIKNTSQKKAERKERIKNDIEIAKILASGNENHGRLNMNLGKELQSLEKHLETPNEPLSVQNEPKESQNESPNYSRPKQSDEISKLYNEDN